MLSLLGRTFMDTSYFRQQVMLGGAVPAAMLMWDSLRGQLGANTVNNALHITGILSLVCLFLSLAVTPLRVLTGWSWLIVSRRSLGLYGFMYAILHLVIYVVWDRMGSLSSTVEEIASRRFLTIGFIALLLMVPLAVTSTNEMIRRMGAARWKLLHRLAYVVAVLGVIHYYMLVKSDVRQPMAFALVLTPLLGFRAVKHYVDLRGLANRPGRPATAQPAESKLAENKFFRGELLVANIHAETPDVKTFRLVNPHGGEIPFRHRPGQYLTLHLEIDGVRLRRSYTIASAPSQRGYVELTIKRHPQGTVSNYMHERVQVGQRIQLAAPGGRFCFDGSTRRRVLLIAGGVGITPVMSMLRYLTDTGWTGEIVFLNAARTGQDLIFANELNYLVSRHSNLKLVNFLSQAKSVIRDHEQQGNLDNDSRTSQIREGYITALAIKELIADLNQTAVYLCGPEPMMAAMRTTLTGLGLDNSQIYTEEFLSPKMNSDDVPLDDAKEGGFETSVAVSSQVVFTRSATTIQVDPQQTLLEATELNNVRIESECRSGICGQCKVRCLAGRVVMETADALSLSEKRNGWILACQSRAASPELEIEA